MRLTDEVTRDDAVGRWRTIRSVGIVSMVLVSMVLAGCSGIPLLGGSDGPNVDASSEFTDKVSVSPGTVYQNVEELTGIEARNYPDVLVVYQGIGTRTDQNATGMFLRKLVGPPEQSDATIPTVESVYDPVDDTIRVNISLLNRASDARLQSILAGQFYRALMYQQNWTEFNQDTGALEGKVADLASRDGFVPLTLVQGSVNYVEKAYANEYLDTEITVAPPLDEDASVYDRWFVVDQSRIGMEHFQQTLDSPSGLSEYFSGDISASTTEEIIHDKNEEPKELSVETASDNWWERAQRSVRGPSVSLLPDPRQPRGELGVQYVLSDQLSTSEAAAAAEGWAGDQVAVMESYYGNDSAGVVWALRWDSASDADEFENAMQTLIESRSDDSDTQFELQRPSEDTTLVLAGDQGFYRHVSVEYSGTTVTVVAGNPD